MTKPLVSVCIPTYNGAAHLAECLDSVCSQTYGNCEILVVDDCSSDETVALVESYRRQDGRMRVVQNKRNLGLIGNWQRCIDLARGDYIKFAFQDDVLYPSFIEALVRALEGGARFAFCAREFIFEEGTDPSLQITLERGRRRIDRFFAEKRLIEPHVYCEALLQALPWNIVGEPTVTLLHRDLFTTYGGFNADYMQMLDYEFWCRIGVNERICYVPQVLAKFRLHSASTTSRNLSTRAYRARVVDPMLLLHDFAFAPVFERLRSVARSWRPPVEMVDLFYEQAHWSSGMAGQEFGGPDVARNLACSALSDIAKRYPAVLPALLGEIPMKYTLRRKWRSLKRLLRPPERATANRVA
jgi:glycosyltransferase involved in cell wall biosynthesis